MNQQNDYVVFENNGFKVDTATFQLLPLNPEDAPDEPVFITDIASWDLYDIYGLMSEEEKELFNQLLMKAVRMSRTLA
jgi:Holliday junction resolvasome RuvABC DNA-binding subunit